MAPPFQNRRSRLWKIAGWYIVALFAHSLIDPGGPHAFMWSLKALVVGWLAKLFVQAVRDERVPIGWLLTRLTTLTTPVPEVLPALKADAQLTPGEAVRAEIARLGGGGYLGLSRNGRWLLADQKHAVMVLGPPQSGKTASVFIPTIAAASGAVISTSTKPDVMRATLKARSEIGQAWLFDPTGSVRELPDGVRRLNWSPVTAASTWDGALMMAQAMTTHTRPGSGTTNESHWTERAGSLLAPLLYAANQAGLPVGEVLKWVHHHDLGPVLEILADCDVAIAADVIMGVQRTESRERSSIISAAIGVLSAYKSVAIQESAAHPNFDAERFIRSQDTIYITAPEHHQRMCAPLVVGLLEEVRHAVYERSASEPVNWAAVVLAVDEAPNIAPMHDPLSLLSQAGGQGLKVYFGIQDMAQAASVWGQLVADAFMTMFQVKVILSGIGHVPTLENISVALGEFDRRTVSSSIGLSDPQEWLSTDTHNESVNYQTQRQRVLTPGEIGKMPEGQALLMQGTDWEPLTLTEWFKNEPWRTVAGEEALKRGSVPGPAILPERNGRAAMRSPRRSRPPTSERGVRAVRGGSTVGRSSRRRDVRAGRAVYVAKATEGSGGCIR
jgi:type IV secretory pathway TraG/TraD family ATPase VirD4